MRQFFFLSWTAVPTATPLIVGVFMQVFTIAAQADVTDGLVAHYAFEGNVLDGSGNGNHGTGFGGINFVSGAFGQAASFDGLDDYVETPRSISGDFSVAFWLRTTHNAPAGSFWFEGLGLVDGEVCGSPSGGDWGIAQLNGGQIAYGGTVAAVTVNDGVWHSVVLTRESGGVANLYVDAKLSASGVAEALALDAPPWIGLGNNPCDVAFNRNWYKGQLDEVRFYNRALTFPEVLELSEPLFTDRFESGGGR